MASNVKCVCAAAAALLFFLYAKSKKANTVAVLTGAVLLGERMTGREIAGCVLMFAAVILAQLSTVLKGKHVIKKGS